jgi:hypothetical protein
LKSHHPFHSDESFVSKLKKTVAILEPIDFLIEKYQSDLVPLSEVDPDLMGLMVGYDALLAKRVITRPECSQLKHLISQRADFLRTKAHGLCNLLDPRFLGQCYDQKQREHYETVMLDYSAPEVALVTNETKEAMYQLWTDFCVKATVQKENATFRFSKKKNACSFFVATSNSKTKRRPQHNIGLLKDAHGHCCEIWLGWCLV